MSRKNRGNIKSSKKDDRHFLLICEGKTETNYFGFLNRYFKKPEVKLFVHDAGGKPADEMIEYAEKALKRDWRFANVRPDNVWLVFDYDARPETREYLTQIEDSPYNYMFCNYCLESWFALHFAHILNLLANHRIYI